VEISIVSMCVQFCVRKTPELRQLLQILHKAKTTELQ